jgi:Enoyl-CoA hydratase/isomerase
LRRERQQRHRRHQRHQRHPRYQQHQQHQRTSGAHPAEASAVLHELRGQVFWITINRPDKRNAINAAVIAGIRDGYRLAHAEPDVRAIVLTASGTRAFCAGGDLQPGKGFAFDLSRPNVDYADLLREAQNATLPTIARVNGVCMAGGPAVHDRSRGRRRRCVVRSAGGQGRRVSDAGDEPAAALGAASPGA